MHMRIFLCKIGYAAASGGDHLAEMVAKLRPICKPFAFPAKKRIANENKKLGKLHGK